MIEADIRHQGRKWQKLYYMMNQKSVEKRRFKFLRNFQIFPTDLIAYHSTLSSSPSSGLIKMAPINLAGALLRAAKKSYPSLKQLCSFFRVNKLTDIKFVSFH